MGRIESILVVIGDERRERQTLLKGVALARLLHSRLELFQCNADVAFFQRHQYETTAAQTAQARCAAESRERLQALWQSLAVHDIPVAIDGTCESPEYESIVRKAERCQADLVIRGLRAAPNGGGEVAGASDWDLVRACPVPLLLTRGRMWGRGLRVAAAVDISDDEAPALTQSILTCARRLTPAGSGGLEILYADPFEGSAPQALKEHQAKFAERAWEVDVDPVGLHVLPGDPATVIPEFAAHRAYDLLVIGALTHRKSLTALVGTLTGRLMEALDADLLVVKVPADRSIRTRRAHGSGGRA